MEQRLEADDQQFAAADGDQHAQGVGPERRSQGQSQDAKGGNHSQRAAVRQQGHAQHQRVQRGRLVRGEIADDARVHPARLALAHFMRDVHEERHRRQRDAEREGEALNKKGP